MSGSIEKSVLRSIPPVDELLGAQDIAGLRARHPHFPWTHFIRNVVDDFRRGRLGPVTREAADRGAIGALIMQEAMDRFDELQSGGVKRVINATGVILHTNLGRAVVGADVQEAVREAMAHYVSLEVDLKSGKRGPRAERLDELIRLATGAESAMVVNNNAAAVHLVVDSFSPPGRVLIHLVRPRPLVVTGGLSFMQKHTSQYSIGRRGRQRFVPVRVYFTSGANEQTRRVLRSICLINGISDTEIFFKCALVSETLRVSPPIRFQAATPGPVF